MIYNEKMTGTKKDRPELSKLLDRMTEGDTVVVAELSRLGRSTKDLIELTEQFHQKRRSSRQPERIHRHRHQRRQTPIHSHVDYRVI